MRGSIRRQIVGQHSSPFLGPFWRPRSFPGNSATGKNEEEARTTRTELSEKSVKSIALGGGDVWLRRRRAGGRVRRCRCLRCTAVYRHQLMSCCSGSLRPTSSQAALLLTAERSRAAFSLRPLLLLLLLLLRCGEPQSTRALRFYPLWLLLLPPQ